MIEKYEVDIEKLHEYRLKKGYSISDIAAEAGFKTPTGYWLVEKGQRKVSVSLLCCIAKMYGVPMETFIKKH